MLETYQLSRFALAIAEGLKVFDECMNQNGVAHDFVTYPVRLHSESMDTVTQFDRPNTNTGKPS